MRAKRSVVVVLPAGSLLGTTGLTSGASAALPEVTVVAKKLQGPFGIAFGPDGKLYVAESATGTVSRTNLSTGRRTTYLKGFPNVSAVDAAKNGTVYALTGTGEKPGPTDTRLFKAPHPGHAKEIANLLTYERNANPDGQRQGTGPNADALSNPFAVLRLRGRTLVADGGGNSVLKVSDNGRVSTFFAPRNIRSAVCLSTPNNDPQHPGCDPVPTGLALGPDGAVYVSGEGAGRPGAARIWKLDAHSGKVLRTWTGLTGLTGIAVGDDGSIYVSEATYGAPEGEPGPNFDPRTVGRITKISPKGVRTHVRVTMPVGLAFHCGKLYSSAWSLHFFGLPAGAGQVVRVSPKAFR